jgi:hypothetical protein
VNRKISWEREEEMQKKWRCETGRVHITEDPPPTTAADSSRLYNRNISISISSAKA